MKPDVETWNSLTSLSEDTCLLRSLFWDLVLVLGDDPHGDGWLQRPEGVEEVFFSLTVSF